MKLQKPIAKGFVALLSVMIISVALLGLVLSSSTVTFFSRFNELDREAHAQAVSLARGCADIALLHLVENYNYTASHEEVFLDSAQCAIESIATVQSSTTAKLVQIQTSANYRSSFAKLNVVAVIQDPATSTPNASLIQVTGSFVY